MQKTYFPLLDVLRFFAATSVLLFHYFSSAIKESTGYIARYVNHGYLGVELFFMISGFVIFFSLQKGTKEYAVGRFVRLYPLFWILCTVTYCLTLMFTPQEALSFKQFLLNLLMINNNQTALLVDGVYWTLTQELIFYIAIGAFVHFFTQRRIEWFFGIWLLISFGTFFFNIENLFITKILLSRYAAFFTIGGMAALIYTERHSPVSKGLWCIRRIILAVALLLPLYVSEQLKGGVAAITNRFGIFYHDGYIILAMLTLLFFIGIYANERIKNKKVIELSVILGAMTYPLYLIHNKIGIITINQFEEFGQISIISVSVAIGIIAISHLVSVGEAKLRKPLHIRIRKMLKI